MKRVLAATICSIPAEKEQKFYVEIAVEIGLLRVDVERLFDAYRICSFFNIPQKEFRALARKHPVELDGWTDIPFFFSEQDAKDFLEDLSPYLVMFQLTQQE